MLTLKKGDAVKFLSPESSLIKVLKFEGWEVEGEKKQESDDLLDLRAQAEALGLKVHHKAGAEKIKEMIEAAKKEAA